MTSGRLGGQYSIYLMNGSGRRVPVKQANSSYWDVMGLGSPDGVPSTTATPEKQNFLPVSADAGTSGYSIVITAKVSATDGLDASDCFGIIPVVVNGNSETIGIPGGNGLGNSNFIADLSATDSTFTQDIEQDVCIIRAKEGVRSFRVGGNRIFMSLEDDTA